MANSAHRGRDTCRENCWGGEIVSGMMRRTEPIMELKGGREGRGGNTADILAICYPTSHSDKTNLRRAAATTKRGEAHISNRGPAQHDCCHQVPSSSGKAKAVSAPGDHVCSHPRGNGANGIAPSQAPGAASCGYLQRFSRRDAACRKRRQVLGSGRQDLAIQRPALVQMHLDGEQSSVQMRAWGWHRQGRVSDSGVFTKKETDNTNAHKRTGDGVVVHGP